MHSDEEYAVPDKSELIGEVVSLVHERLSEGEATPVEEFVRQYYGWVTREDLEEYTAIDLYGAALAHWNFARERTPGAAKVNVYNPPIRGARLAVAPHYRRDRQ